MTNVKKLQALLGDGLDAILLTGEANRQYATGGQISEGMCLVTPRRCLYFTDSRYFETAKNQLHGITVQEATRERGYTAWIQMILNEGGIQTLGVEEEELTHGGFIRLSEKLSASLVPCQKKLNALRQVKEPWEMDLMRKAQNIADKVFSEILPVIREGMTEKELEAELIYRLYRAGAEGLSFPPIVVSGPNTSMPHGVAGTRKIIPGDFITMDFGIKLQGYCSDMTRTVALGYATEKMRNIYHIVLQAQKEAISGTRAGRTGAEIDAIARNIIADAGYGAYFGHGYGHSLGLEIHESPNCSPSNPNPIPAGAVISAEPGIYLPGEFGVRIEDVVVVTPDGCENLTHSPKELIIL
ncbi:MAG: aminopeptidase P family protein [Ruminococcaceae bacterium]|nr:aminopeptidase P family protein [Oscillospiraceae bacterium]